MAFASSFARNMDRLFADGEPPAIVYVTNPSDRHGNLMNEIIRASVEALIRGWRHEDETLANAGDLTWAVQPNQMVRYDTEDDEALTFAADWAATLTNRVRKMDSINLWLPRSIKRSTGRAQCPPPSRACYLVTQRSHRGHYWRKSRYWSSTRSIPCDCRCASSSKRPKRRQARRSSR